MHRTLAVAPALALLVVSLAMAADPAPPAWPQWRGPNRDGVAPEGSGLPGGWPPKRLWEKNVGPGCSSPILAAGRVYVTGWNGKADRRKNPRGTDTVYCFEATTGKELWKRTYPSRYQSRTRAGDLGQYGGPSSTPTFHAATGMLYTLGVDGELRCWDTAREGKPVWGVNLYDTCKVPQRPNVGGGKRDFGFTSAPLVLGDRLLVELGGPAGTVIALDKATGKATWRSACTEPAGHTSGPVPITLQGRQCIATLTLRKLVVMRADKGHEGRTVAEIPWQTDFACNIPTPAVVGNKVVPTSAYNQHKTSLVDLSGRKPRQVWTSKEHAMVGSPVVHKGRVFLVRGSLRCLDLASGKLIWKGGKFGHGSCLVAAGDNKVIVFGKGRLALVDAMAREYKELGHVDGLVRGTCYPQVALADGLILCKDKDGRLVCLSVRGGAEK